MEIDDDTFCRDNSPLCRHIKPVVSHFVFERKLVGPFSKQRLDFYQGGFTFNVVVIGLTKSLWGVNWLFPLQKQWWSLRIFCSEEFSLNFLTWCQNLLSSCHLLDARAGGAKPSINHNIMFLQSPQIIDFLWVTWERFLKWLLRQLGYLKTGLNRSVWCFSKPLNFTLGTAKKTTRSCHKSCNNCRNRDVFVFQWRKSTK